MWGLARRNLPLALLALVATVSMWPIYGSRPAAGLDPSWATGLHLAWRNRLDFGDDLSFTYGPLGFVLFPNSVTRSGLLLSLVVVTVLISTFVVLTYRLVLLITRRHHLAIGLALALALAAPRNGAYLSELVLFALVGSVISLLVRPARRQTAWLVACGGLAGVLLLCKTSVGFVALGAVGLLALNERRRIAAVGMVLGALFGTLVVTWLMLGQSLDAIPAWFRDVLEVNSGYSWAMGIEERTRAWEYVAVPGALVAVVVIGVRRRAAFVAAVPSALARWSIGVVAFAGSFLAFKEGFIRHDQHSIVFFYLLLYGVVVVTPWPVEPDRRWPVLASWSLALVLLLANTGKPVASLFDPTASAYGFTRAVNQLISRDAQLDDLQLAREETHQAYALPTEVLEAVQGRAVHVDPWETTLVWTYDLAWRPTRVFQRYTAYTEHLDRENADVLASLAGPDVVLRSADPAIDERYDLLEAPQAMVVMLCRFAPVADQGRWQVLGRSEDRCGQREELATVRAAAGEVIEVPRVQSGRDAVLVQIDFDISLWDRLVATAWKSDTYRMTLDGDTYRVLPLVTTAPGPLYIPTSSGWIDPIRGRTVPPSTMVLDHSATVTFYRLPVG